MHKFRLQICTFRNDSREEWQSIASFHSAAQREAHAAQYPRTEYRRIHVRDNGSEALG